VYALVTFFIGQVLPYVAVVIFTLGILYRLWRWAAARIIHNVTLSPFPQSNAQVAGIYAGEIVLFRNVFLFDKGLWIGAWPMHVALGSVIGGHVVGIYFLGKQFTYIGLSEHLSEQMSALLGTVFGLIMLAGLLVLLYRRLAIDSVRKISVPGDYLHLLLLLGIVSVGNFMRLFPAYGLEYEPAREYITGLVYLNPIPIPDNPLFIIHFLLVQVLLIVFPFSKLMHLFGMFANRWIMNRVYHDPAPGLPGVDLSKGVPVVNAVSEGGVTSAGV